jgi:ATP-dependent DNA ligase
MEIRMEPNIFNMAIVLDDLEQATGSKAKKKIIEKWLPPDDRCGLHLLFQYALASKYTFGITNWDGYVFQQHIENATGAVPELLRSLLNRQLTGYSARDVVGTLAECLDEQSHREGVFTGTISPSEALRRILCKDLSVGVGAKLINDVYPGLIPVFEVQLAPSEQADPEKMKYPCWIEPKWDGMRLPAVPDQHGNIKFFSRDGEEQDNFEELEELFDTILPKGYMFDGEIVDKVNSFSKLLSRAKSDRGTKTENAPLLSYRMFDMLTIDEWNRVTVPPSYEIRRARMTEVVNQHILFDLQEEAQAALSEKYGRTPTISISPATKVEDYEQFKIINADFLKITVEGIMRKDPDRSYEFDRTNAWEKIKPMMEGSAEIVGVTEGGTGRNKGLLKNVKIKGMFSDPRRGIASPVECTGDLGGGFDDEMRRYITEEHRAGRLIGRVLDLKYQEISQNKKSAEEGKYSLRFLTFLRFRGEVPGEKL